MLSQRHSQDLQQISLISTNILKIDNFHQSSTRRQTQDLRLSQQNYQAVQQMFSISKKRILMIISIEVLRGSKINEYFLD